MKLLRLLKRLPLFPPTMMIPPVGMWCTWLLATQKDVVLFGVVLSPVILAVIVLIVLPFSVNLFRKTVVRARWKSSPKTQVVTHSLMFCALGLILWMNDPWLLKMAWSLTIFIVAVIFLIAALIDPLTMIDYPNLSYAQRPYSPDAYIIRSSLWILQAFIGVVIARYASDAAWIAYAGLCSIIIFMITRATATAWCAYKNSRIHRI